MPRLIGCAGRPRRRSRGRVLGEVGESGPPRAQQRVVGRFVRAGRVRYQRVAPRPPQELRRRVHDPEPGLAEAAADDSENCGLRYLGCTVRRAGALEILKIRRVAADSFSSLADVQANFRSALTPLGCAANDLDVRVRARAIYALGEHARYISQTPSCPISRLNDTLLSIAPAGGATDADATTTEAFDLATPPSAAVAVAWSGVQHVARPLCPPPSLCAATLLLRDSTVPSEEAAGFASPRDSLRRLLCTVRREREARRAQRHLSGQLLSSSPERAARRIAWALWHPELAICGVGSARDGTERERRAARRSAAERGELS